MWHVQLLKDCLPFLMRAMGCNNNDNSNTIKYFIQSVGKVAACHHELHCDIINVSGFICHSGNGNFT